MNKGAISIITLILFFTGCTEPMLPKQHGYPHINFPAHAYQTWDQTSAPFVFDKPVYANMVPDQEEMWWYNLTYLPFDATLHLSYREFKSPEELDTLIHDTRVLVYKHVIKATDIIDTEIADSNGRAGMMYDLEGETATSCNFYLTDNKSKFFRGALYFNNFTTIDSVGPVVDFIKADIHQMVRSFKFK
jgi:gliding motility-associated lipoprotein GldD